MSDDPAMPTPFDPTHDAQRITGTWRYPREEEPDGFCMIHFDEAGWTFQSFFDADAPKTRIPMRLIWVVESEGQIRMSTEPGEEGWLVGYAYDREKDTLVVENGTMVCTRVSPAEMPGWFVDALSREVKKG